MVKVAYNPETNKVQYNSTTGKLSTCCCIEGSSVCSNCPDGTTPSKINVSVNDSSGFVACTGDDGGGGFLTGGDGCLSAICGALITVTGVENITFDGELERVDPCTWETVVDISSFGIELLIEVCLGDDPPTPCESKEYENCIAPGSRVSCYTVDITGMLIRLEKACGATYCKWTATVRLLEDFTGLANIQTWIAGSTTEDLDCDKTECLCCDADFVAQKTDCSIESTLFKNGSFEIKQPCPG